MCGDMQRNVHGNRMIGSDLANPDFVKLGESFGILSLRARNPDALRAALEKALAADEPALIEVPVGDMPFPWPFIDLPRVRGEEAGLRVAERRQARRGRARPSPARTPDTPPACRRG